MSQMAQQLKNRLPADDARYRSKQNGLSPASVGHMEQILALDGLTACRYKDPAINYASKNANVDDMDWRVPYLLWCKDATIGP
eukprot:6456831-Amphidinium_carterae.1